VLLLPQITPLEDLSRVSLDLFSIHFVITKHSSIAEMSASQYKKKLTLNKCHQYLSCLAISCLAILMVRHYHVRHFQRSLRYSGLEDVWTRIYGGADTELAEITNRQSRSGSCKWHPNIRDAILVCLVCLLSVGLWSCYIIIIYINIYSQIHL